MYDYNLFALYPPTGLCPETGERWIWHQELPHEVRTTCTAADSAIYVGIDTGYQLFKRDASDGGWLSEFQSYFGRYFVGSAAVTTANLLYSGNDDGYFYVLPTSDLTYPIADYYTGGIISSTPAIIYAAEDGARWVYITSRANGGTLIAFRTSL